jgi:hypothetical protein
MNVGLILFISSLLAGSPDDKPANSPSEKQKLNNGEKTTSELIISDDDYASNDIHHDSTKNNTDIKERVNKESSDFSISGDAKKIVFQDEFYAFTPLVKDLKKTKLEFSIKNKPNWGIFDSRTGSLSGKPSNLDVGISKNITISVVRSKSRKISLDPFNIEIVNINDSPEISGIPNKYIEYGKRYEFIPKVKDIDLDIGKETLIFSIKNKPKWALFNSLTGALTGSLNNKIIQHGLMYVGKFLMKL